VRVTVGLPFLNAQQTLSDAIRSVFAQTFHDWELILVDDGSTDASLEIARSIRDPRVKVLSDGANLGLPARLNQVAALAQGEFLARMDADDLMHPDRLARQIECLDSDEQPDLVGTGVYVVDAAANPIGIRDLEPIDTRPEAALAQPILPHPTVTGRTRWFRENPYDESFPRAEDYELWLRTCAESKFAKITEPLHYFREGVRQPGKYLVEYIRTARSVRKVLRLHSPLAVGRPRVLRLLASSYLKEFTYRLATPAGVQRRLMQMRYGRPLSGAELEAALDGLKTIAAAEVGQP